MTGVPETILSHNKKREICSEHISADPICPFPKKTDDMKSSGALGGLGSLGLGFRVLGFRVSALSSDLLQVGALHGQLALEGPGQLSLIAMMNSY